MSQSPQASTYSSELFRPHLGDTFEIVTEAGALPAELIQVTDLVEAPDDRHQTRQFSVVWRGPRETVLPQQIYPLRHPEIGTLELFLVTIGPDAEGMRYEAVFT